MDGCRDSDIRLKRLAFISVSEALRGTTGSIIEALSLGGRSADLISLL